MKQIHKPYIFTLLTLVLFTLASVPSCQASLGASRAPQEIHGTRQVEPGYASSFLALVHGHIARKEIFNLDPIIGEVLDYQGFYPSLLMAFDMARERMFEAKDFLELLPSFKDISHNPSAGPWEGRCHNWAAASTDPKVQELARVDGLFCGGVVFNREDLHELFTLTYDAQNAREFYGERTYLPTTQDRELNHTDLDLREELHRYNLKPHQFHTVIHESFEKGTGVVLNTHTRGEVWNFPVHKIESTVTPWKSPSIAQNGGDTLPYFYDFMYDTTQPQHKSMVDDIGKINWALHLLLDKKDKPGDATLTETLLQLSSTGIEGLPDDLAYKIRVKESGILAGTQKRTPTHLAEITRLLQRSKKELYSEAIKRGLQLKDQYEVHTVVSQVHFLQESSYRKPDRTPDGQFHPTIQGKRTFTYHMIKDKADPKAPLFSFWQTVKGYENRPDFMWLSPCSTILCDQKAQELRDKIAQMQSLDPQFNAVEWLKDTSDDPYHGRLLALGLSDLLKLFERCTPLDQVRVWAKKFKASLEALKDQKPHRITATQKENLLKLQAQLKNLKVDFNQKNLLKILRNSPALKVDSEGFISFI